MTILNLLYAVCLGFIKAGHGAGIRWGRLALFFAMPISCYAVSNSFIATILFMIPILFYVDGSGALHKAQPTNTSTDTTESKLIDPIAHKLAGFIKNNWGYTQKWGFAYSTVLGFIFCLPFLYTNLFYGLPCLLLPFACRYLPWRDVEFLILFIYSLFYFSSF
jgi:hypothetical protein